MPAASHGRSIRARPDQLLGHPSRTPLADGLLYIVPMAASLLPKLRAYLIELVVFAACAVQYWTLESVRRIAGDERFFWQSIILLCATVLILALLATYKPRERVSS